MVGLSGLEPETFRLSGGCSNQLSYKPPLIQAAWQGGRRSVRRKDIPEGIQARQYDHGFRMQYAFVKDTGTWPVRSACADEHAAWLGNAIAVVRS